MREALGYLAPYMGLALLAFLFCIGLLFFGEWMSKR